MSAEEIARVGDVRVQRVITHGTFDLDGGSWEVDNNIWLVGNDTEVIVVDAAHSAGPIEAAVAGRTVRGILLTHGHNDHVTVAPQLSRDLDAPALLHPGDDVLWQQTHPGVSYRELAGDEHIEVAGTQLQILHAPGHSPGSVAIYAPELGVLFSGDTLFNGGPGATGRSYSDFPTIIESIRDRILVLPPETTVLTGHGDSTRVGQEAPHLEEWIARGH